MPGNTAADLALPHPQQVDDDVDLDALAGLTDGYSGADVAIVCRDAAMMSVRRVMKGALERGLSGPEIQKHIMDMKDELAAAVTMEDFRSSLRKVGVNYIRRYVALLRLQLWRSSFFRMSSANINATERIFSMIGSYVFQPLRSECTLHPSVAY